MIDLRENLAALESRLHNELYDLRMMIRTLVPQNNHQDYYRDQYRDQNSYRHQQSYNEPRYQQDYYNQRKPASPPKDYYQNRDYNNIQQTYLKTSTRPTVQLKSIDTTISETSTTTESYIKPPVVVNVINKLKSLETAKSKLFKESTTQIASSTTTTQSPPVPSKNEYTYYWKLENFPKAFINAKKNEIFSHVFNVKGLFLRIRAALQLMENQNLVLDIEHLANVENVNQLEIEISDGLVFKEIAEEKLFQYSFAIMDQTKPNHDLISPIYWNTETDNFLVPNSVHLLANYVKNDSLLIKFIITF